MPNQTHSKNSIPKNYDAGDLYDAHVLAETDMQWMSVAITDIKSRLRNVKKELEHTNIVGLYALENVIEMYEYIAECRFNCHSSQSEYFKKEHEANKKAVTA